MIHVSCLMGDEKKDRSPPLFIVSMMSGIKSGQQFVDDLSLKRSVSLFCDLTSPTPSSIHCNRRLLDTVRTAMPHSQEGHRSYSDICREQQADSDSLLGQRKITITGCRLRRGARLMIAI